MRADLAAVAGRGNNYRLEAALVGHQGHFVEFLDAAVVQDAGVVDFLAELGLLALQLHLLLLVLALVLEHRVKPGVVHLAELEVALEPEHVGVDGVEGLGARFLGGRLVLRLHRLQHFDLGDQILDRGVVIGEGPLQDLELDSG